MPYMECLGNIDPTSSTIGHDPIVKYGVRVDLQVFVRMFARTMSTVQPHVFEQQTGRWLGN